VSNVHRTSQRVPVSSPTFQTGVREKVLRGHALLAQMPLCTEHPVLLTSLSRTRLQVPFAITRGDIWGVWPRTGRLPSEAPSSCIAVKFPVSAFPEAPPAP
jgi:hypothetical protein